MYTIKNLVLFLLATTILASCGKVTYRKTPGGMPYQLYKGSDTQKVFAGNILKMHLSYKVKDSVYFNSFGKIPVYMPVGHESQPYDISEILSSLKIGDSIIATQMLDTFIKRNPTGIPPDFKKGDRIVTVLKVLGIFENDSTAQADEEMEKKNFLAVEITTLEKYLKEKNISVEKTSSGAFIQMIEPGTGNPIDSGNYVSVNYTGTTLNGIKFDSNTDSAFNHVGPYGFIVSTGQMIKGFDEAVASMKMGASAKVYIPSMLAYGSRPQPGSAIKPFETLVFDITVVDVKDKAPEAQLTELPKKKLKVDAAQGQK